MQHLNYFFLRQLAENLHERLRGGRLQDAFTQEKDELVLVFRTAKGHPYFLRISCRNDFPYFLPQQQYRRARANSVDLFESLQDLAVLSVEIAPGDRLICIQLAEEQALWVKLHGRRANVLHVANGAVEGLFRQDRTEDATLDWPLEPFRFPADEVAWQAFAAQHPEASQNELLKRAFPVLDRELRFVLATEIEKGASPVAAAKEVMRAAAEPPVWLGEGLGGLAFWVVAPPKSRPAPDGAAFEFQRFDDPADGLRRYVQLWLRRKRTQELRHATTYAVQRVVKRAEDQYTTALAGIKRLSTQRSAEADGHLLMAYLHEVQPDSEQITLTDFYTGEPVTLKLEPKLSPQANAERFYAKHKANQRKLAQLRERLTKLSSDLEQAQLLYARYEALPADDPKALQQFRERHAKRLNLQTERPADELPFRQFEVQGYQIWVGKSAANNDKLTTAYARKHDLWLHAKDVQGSHVILRLRKEETAPEAVLETAAGLAAWFSKSRTSGLVPVTYTPRKFVRKPKRLPPGAVFVDREEVLLIEPLDPASVPQFAVLAQ